MANQVQINGITYNLIQEKPFGVFGRTEMTLRRPNGNRAYHAIRYEDGSLSEAV